MTMTTEETEKPRKVRGPYAKTKVTRRAILDAATEVFSKTGYRAGSLRQIAARVGMSEASIFHHFPSKEALLEAVLDERDQRSKEIVAFGADASETIRGIIRLAQEITSVPGLVELYCQLLIEAADEEHPAHERFLKQRHETLEMVRATFFQLEQEQRLRPGVSPEAATRMVTAMFDGVQARWLLDPEQMNMAETLRSFFDLLVDIDWDAPRDADA